MSGQIRPPRNASNPKASLTDLPAEILIQIMCEFRYIRPVLRLSSACRRTRQVWCDNAVVIASNVFSFPREELLAMVQLARLEASVTPGAALPEPLHEQQQALVNAAVLAHLPFLATLSLSALALHRLTTFHPSSHHPPFPPPDPAQQLHYCAQTLHLLQRFITGFRHPFTLPAAYATLRALPDRELSWSNDIVHNIRQQWPRLAKTLRIQARPPTFTADKGAPRLPWRMPQTLPMPWEFGLRVFSNEGYWRPPPPLVEGETAGQRRRRPREEAFYVLGWEEMWKKFGKERVVGMYMGEGTPWAEERERVRREMEEGG